MSDQGTTPEHGITPEMVAAEVPSLKAETVTTAVIDRVVDTVRQLCGWHVWPEREETIVVDSAGDSTIFLPTLHLADVLSVKARDVEIEADRWEWSESGWLKTRHGRWPDGARAITVEAVHGFRSCPALVAVCAQMIGRSLTAGQDGYTVGGITVGARSGITPQSTEWRIIDRYRLEPTP